MLSPLVTAVHQNTDRNTVERFLVFLRDEINLNDAINDVGAFQNNRIADLKVAAGIESIGVIAAFVALQLLDILIFQDLSGLQIIVLDRKVLLA